MPDLADILYPGQGKDYGNRSDGSKKGKGFLGEMQRPDGSVSTEISAGFEVDGKEMDIPLMVPGLTKKELDYLLNTQADEKTFLKNLPDSIAEKAIAHAEKRLKQGKSVFYVDGEDDK